MKIVTQSLQHSPADAKPVYEPVEQYVKSSRHVKEHKDDALLVVNSMQETFIDPEKSRSGATSPLNQPHTGL